MKYPDFTQMSVRMRLAELSTELVAELPRDRGEALLVLASTLCACAASEGVLSDVVPMVRALASFYGHGADAELPARQIANDPRPGE